MEEIWIAWRQRIVYIFIEPIFIYMIESGSMASNITLPYKIPNLNLCYVDLLILSACQE